MMNKIYNNIDDYEMKSKESKIVPRFCEITYILMELVNVFYLILLIKKYNFYYQI